MNEPLAHHLALHQGLVRVRDAVPALVTRNAFFGMVERRELVAVHRGVYRHAAVPVTLEQRIHAALVATGPAAVLSHRAALARHGVRDQVRRALAASASSA